MYVSMHACMVAMSTRLLLQLAGPVPSWKKRAAPVRCLLNTARYPLKTRYRHTTAYDTEKVHRPSKIRRATQHRSHVRVLRNVSEPPLCEYFCREYFCHPFWKRFVKIFGRENFATYGIHTDSSIRINMWVETTLYSSTHYSHGCHFEQETCPPTVQTSHK